MPMDPEAAGGAGGNGALLSCLRAPELWEMMGRTRWWG